MFSAEHVTMVKTHDYRRHKYERMKKKLIRTDVKQILIIIIVSADDV